jgi:preprotein translocase SecE subunit
MCRSSSACLGTLPEVEPEPHGSRLPPLPPRPPAPPATAFGGSDDGGGGKRRPTRDWGDPPREPFSLAGWLRSAWAEWRKVVWPTREATSRNVVVVAAVILLVLAVCAAGFAIH